MTTATAKVPRLVGGVLEVRTSARSAPRLREMSFATIGDLAQISTTGRRHQGCCNPGSHLGAETLSPAAKDRADQHPVPPTVTRDAPVIIAHNREPRAA